MKSIKLIWIFIFLLGIGIRSTQIFHPIDTESWRESDVATIAKNFYYNHTDIFHPQVAWDGYGPGYTESEFPIYPYLIAISYKIFGFWEPIGRIISFLFSIASLFVFFKLSSYLLDKKSSIIASLCFATSPILMVISNTLQPESLMFFCYLTSGYFFIRWLTESSKIFLVITIIFTALALLCKLTAANIGIMFLLMILLKKGWKFIFTTQVILLGVLSLLPSVFWYGYCHQFYIKYGNSLGLSNEHAWIGVDFFTNKNFILGILRMELLHVWTKVGPLIVLMAYLFTSWRKNHIALIAAIWYISAFLFYIIAARTTSADWAYYYHIFSIPAVCILIATSITALYGQYISYIKNGEKINISNALKLKNRVVFILSGFMLLYFGLAVGKYFLVLKNTNFQTSYYYSCSDSLKKIIPEGSLFLANGGFCNDDMGNSKAYNNSYFFYWLNRKGYNICIEDLSIKNIIAYRKIGAAYFLAEEKIILEKSGLVEALKKNFITLYKSNGCILFKL